MKRTLKFIWRSVAAFILATLLFFFVIQPFFRCVSLRRSVFDALDGAGSVRLVEHSTRFDSPHADRENYQETIYSDVVLSPDQINAFRHALPLTLDFSGSVILACLFQEHHVVEIIQADGKAFTFHICFTCGEIKLNNGNQRIMPWGWNSTLSSFIKSVGLRPNGPFQK
jgi:hypothetical protein